MATPKIILYTNHLCPWAARAHIALKELGLPYEEVIIDLDTPREPWYLKVNPRGLVPSISYDGTIITESAIVARFLADSHPSHLLPESLPTNNALYRARVDFFVDAFISKVMPHFWAGVRAANTEEKDAAAQSLVDAVVKEVEPLLEEGKGPFFGGSDKLTFAEVLTGPFLLRIAAFAKPQYGLLSPKVLDLLATKTPKFKRWLDATIAQNSVNFIFDEEEISTRTARKFSAKV